MAERLLCDRSLRVSIDGGGSRTLLVVADGSTVRFWLPTAQAEGVLRGSPIQVSASGAYCGLERVEDRVQLEFGLATKGGKRCEIPAAEFADALAWVRGLGDPYPIEPETP
jgi:hypothetical protein